MNILFTTQHGNFLSVIMHVYHSLKNLDFALDPPYMYMYKVTKKYKCRHADTHSRFKLSTLYSLFRDKADYGVSTELDKLHIHVEGLFHC